MSSIASFASLRGDSVTLQQSLSALGLADLYHAYQISSSSPFTSSSSTSPIAAMKTVRTTDLWSIWPWRQLTQWKPPSTFSSKHLFSSNEAMWKVDQGEGGVAGLLLEYERQVANPLRSITLTVEWMEKAERVVSSEFLNVLQSERRKMSERIKEEEDDDDDD